MNKAYRILSLVILSSTLITTATEDVQQNSSEAISITTETTTLQNAWQNKWVKVGTISTACAIIYAVGVRYNVVPAPSLPTLSLITLPVIGKKVIDANTPSDNQKNDTAPTTTTDNNQEKTAETTIASQDEQLTETRNEKKITLPSVNDMREITDTVKNWLLDGVHNYTPQYEENYQ